MQTRLFRYSHPAFAAAACLVLAGPALAQAPAPVRVEVTGIEGRQRENVLAVLSLRAAAQEGPQPPDRIRRLHDRAPGEIELALEPFGYYRAEIDSELTTQNGGWLARYRVEPGPPIRLESVDVQLRGEGTEDLRLRELARDFPLGAGDVLRHDLYEQAKAALQNRAASQGYLDATFDTAAIRVDLEQYEAEISVRFDTGPRYSFGPVIFQQDILDPGVLAGYVTFQPGDPYDAARLLELQSALSGGPYFSRVEIRPRHDLAEGLRVPIQVEVVPRKSQRYEAGLGYGTDTGPRGTLEVEQRRLNRRGHRAIGEARVSLLEQSVSARYLIPSRYPSTKVLSFRAGFAHLDPATSASDRVLVGASLSRNPRRWQETYSLTFEREAFEVGPDTGTSKLLIPGAAWTRIEADDRISPQRGFRVRLGLQGSIDAVLSTANFLQAKVHFKAVQSIGPRTRLIGRADLGGIVTDELRELPPTIRFFAGGDQSVRGFGYRSLGPADENGSVIGGELLTVVSLEIDYRFLERWGVAVFYDAGDALNRLSLSLEQGAGLGLRWRSPVGYVRADGAFAISRSGPPFRFHFSVGPEL